jgi:hypothetical protein
MSTNAEQTRRLFLEGKTIERILRRAVRHALLEHKRVGNTIAAWEDGRVVLIPAEEIQTADEEAEQSQPLGN